MTNHVFPIPQLSQENWDAIQASLDTIGRIVGELHEKETNGKRKQDFELIEIHLGMLDVYLGRTMPLDIAFNDIKREIKKDA